MRKYIMSALLLLSVVSLSAQTVADGYNFSNLHYYGTARSMALGNAMTAVGGDLGSITINPAGSAVANHSQFTISPGFSTLSNSVKYSPEALTDNFTSSRNNTHTKMILPNVGMSIVLETPASNALKKVTFGVVSNTTQNNDEWLSIKGVSEETTAFGALSYYATGIPWEELESDKAYSSFNYDWDLIMAYRAGLISPIGGGDYVAATEDFDDYYIFLAGPVNQSYSRRKMTGKNDLVFNVGFDINHKLYLGVNFGMPSMWSTEQTAIVETPVNPSDFEYYIDDVLTQFQKGRQGYEFRANAEGIYAGFGVIWLPFPGLRVGASYRTPTLFNVDEVWGWEGETVYSNSKFSAYEKTPRGEYSYNFTTPSTYNLGVALTLPSLGLISVDWTGMNYSRMRFNDIYADFGTDSYEDLNDMIATSNIKSNGLRVGLELKLSKKLSSRFGWTIDKLKEDGEVSKTNSKSIGLGYSSDGAFFADVAVRSTSMPNQWQRMYDDYISDYNSPELRVTNRSILDAVLTIGFRF